MAVGTRGRGKKAAAGDADTPAFGGIAERYRRAGDLDKAVALCREGLKRFPDQISGRVTLGWSLLDQGKYDEAQVELEYALKRAPDNLAAIRGLAELHDRAENTMMLPMDGPGQWPPDSAMIEEAAEAAAQEPVAVAGEPAAVHSPPELEPDTKANGYDTTPAVYTRASDASPTPARKPATRDIDPPVSDAELAALTALLQQEEAQAAAEAQLTLESDAVAEPASVVELAPPIPVSVSGANLALELLEASTRPVETTPELSLSAAEPDALIAALEAHPEPAMAGVTEAVEVSKTFEVPGTLETVDIVGVPAQTYEVPGTLEVAIGEVQDTYEVPGTLEVREAVEVPATFEIPEPVEIADPVEVPEPVEAVEVQPVMEAIEAEPSVDLQERVETPEPVDVPDLEVPTAMTDGAASEEFRQHWSAEAAAPAREPEMPDPGIAAFEDHFQAAETGAHAHAHEVVAFPAKHEDSPARSDETIDRDDDPIHAPALADASAFEARELPTPVDHHDDVELPDVDFAAAASTAPDDFAARIVESAMHARTAASGQESTDFRGPIDLRDPEPSEQQAWAVELTPSALIVPEAPDLRSADADDDDHLRQGYGGQDHLRQGYGGQEENHRTEVVAAPAAAAVAVADLSPFAKAPDDKSPVNRLRKMLRRIEMRRLETARESVA